MEIEMEQSVIELQGVYNFFDIGIVRSVVKKPLSEYDNEKLKSYRIQAKDNSVNLYNVELTTRSAEFKEIPMLIGNTNVETLLINDQVLVGYLGPNKYPFIFSSYLMDLGGNKKAGRLPYNIDEGEKYISGRNANSIYFRKDGALLIRCGENGVIIGGNQGVSDVTNEVVIFSVVNDIYGRMFYADRNGNVFTDAHSNLYLDGNEIKQTARNILDVVVGMEVNDDDKRIGEANVTVYKQATTNIGEKLTVNVGEVRETDKRKTAEAEINIARKVKFNIGTGTTVTVEEENGKSVVDIVTNGREVKIDDDAKEITINQGSHKIVMKEDGIHLGEGATQLAVLGYNFLTKFNTHAHPHPTGPPMVQLTPADVLSQEKVFVK